MVKARIASILNELLKELGETQEGLANRLGVTRSNLQGYLKEKNIPGIDVILRIAELAGITTDALLKKNNPKMNVNVNNSHHFTIANGPVYQNTTIKRTNHYSPGPNDITGDQANKLKDYVNKIVELEGTVKKKPKTYGAVWNALNKKMGVTYYREIKQHQFDSAEVYLKQWAGRLKRGLKRSDEDIYRQVRQKAIFAHARNQLRWTKEDLDGYIFECYDKNSIRDLTINELDQLYNKIFAMK
jgi:transcriptional regulator with XRE-family HTH domain